MSYKLVTYESATGPRAGLTIGDALFDVAASTGKPRWSSMEALLGDWAEASARLSAVAGSGDEKPAERQPGAPARAPLANPGAIFCAGANYHDHVVEMARAQNIQPEADPHTLGLKAWHFIKLARCIAAPDEEVRLPRLSSKVDWEAELAVIIGKAGKDIPVEDAMSHVAGYTIAQDLSARDLGKRMQVADQSPFKYDWVAHKCFDQSCPMGPSITPASEVADPQDLAIELWLNGELRQSSNTGQMIFGIAEQIAHLSEKLTLYPGDIILTGTPAGVGTPKGEFLKPGDVVRVRIEGLGELTNRMA